MSKKFIIFSLIAAVLFSMNVPAYTITNQNQVLNSSTEVNGELFNSSDELPSDGIINILPSSQKINSNGTFTFDVINTVLSSKFKVSSNKLTLNISAKVGNSTNSSHKAEIVFYESRSGVDKKLATYNFYADAGNYSFTLGDLNTSSTYYFKIINNSELPYGKTLVGDGSISNYVH